jgi:hypothetical protein
MNRRYERNEQVEQLTLHEELVAPDCLRFSSAVKLLYKSTMVTFKCSTLLYYFKKLGGTRNQQILANKKGVI